MKKMKFVCTAVALSLAMSTGVVMAGCSGGSTSTANNNATTTNTATAASTDGYATSAEVCSQLSSAFETYLTSSYSSSDADALGGNILKLMPKCIRESSEASSFKSTFSSSFIDSLGDTDTLQQIQQYCKFELSFTQDTAASSSVITTLNEALSEAGSSDTVSEAYTLKMGMKVTMTKDYNGHATGEVIADQTQSMGEGLYVCKVNGRWFIL